MNSEKLLFVSDLENAIADIRRLGYDLSKTPVLIRGIVEGNNPASEVKFLPQHKQSMVISA